MAVVGQTPVVNNTLITLNQKKDLTKEDKELKIMIKILNQHVNLIKKHFEINRESIRALIIIIQETIKQWAIIRDYLGPVKR
jgi:hypothetical protein